LFLLQSTARPNTHPFCRIRNPPLTKANIRDLDGDEVADSYSKHYESTFVHKQLLVSVRYGMVLQYSILRYGIAIQYYDIANTVRQAASKYLIYLKTLEQKE
jgi:hypothetical protein